MKKYKCKIFASSRDDKDQGWVWLDYKFFDQINKPRLTVKIKNLDNGKSVFCEVLNIDSNFTAWYNQPPRISIVQTSDNPAVVMNGWYRAKLGVRATQEDVLLSIKPCNNLYGKVRACLDHPQTVVRVATALALVALGITLAQIVFGC